MSLHRLAAVGRVAELVDVKAVISRGKAGNVARHVDRGGGTANL